MQYADEKAAGQRCVLIRTQLFKICNTKINNIMNEYMEKVVGLPGRGVTKTITKAKKDNA